MLKPLPRPPKGIIVKLTPEQLEKISNAVKLIVEAKIKEGNHYATDGDNLFNRFFGGFCFEFLVAQFLSLPEPDLTPGFSVDYSKPDLKQLGVGVKCVNIGRQHLINRVNKCPQILGYKHSQDTFEIIGLLPTDVLNNYQDDSNVSSNLITRKTHLDSKAFKYLITDIKTWIYQNENN